MKHILILLLSMAVMQGCSVYGSLTKCDGFDEAGSRCTSLMSNLDYSKQREKGVIPEPEEADNTKSKQAETAPDGIICADDTDRCLVKIDYSLLDTQVKNDEFARLTIDKKMGMSETDPVLRPAKTVKATIYPYSDGSKFYQLRHIWIKTIEEAWIVGKTMVVDSKGTTMMDKGVNINTIGADATSASYYPNKGDYERDGKSVLRNDGLDNAAPNTHTTDVTASGSSQEAVGTDSGDTPGIDSADSGSQSANDSDSSKNSKYGNNVKVTIIDDYLSDNNTTEGKSFKSGDVVTINVVYLNVRKEPSEKSTIIGVIPAGGKLQILDEKSDKWQRVRIVYYPKNKLKKEYDGWVHSGYLMAVNPSVEKWEDGL